MNLEELKKKNQVIQNNQVVPSIIKMEYYLIAPEVLKEIYNWNYTTMEEITMAKKRITNLQEELVRKNTLMKEEMIKAVEQKIENQIYHLKRDLKETEEEQKQKISKIKWKTGAIALLIGLLLSAIWFLTHK